MIEVAQNRLLMVKNGIRKVCLESAKLEDFHCELVTFGLSIYIYCVCISIIIIYVRMTFFAMHLAYNSTKQCRMHAEVFRSSTCSIVVLTYMENIPKRKQSRY